MSHASARSAARTAVAVAVAVAWLGSCSDPAPVQDIRRAVDSGLGDERGGTDTGGSETGGSSTGGVGGNGTGGTSNGDNDSCPECREQPGPWSCQPIIRSGGHYCNCGLSGECPSGLVCMKGLSQFSSKCVVPCDLGLDAGRCGAGTVCNPAKRHCTECVTNADCKRPGIKHCTDEGSCVQCLTDADCAGVTSGSRCINGDITNKCGCSTNSDCAASGLRRRCGNSVSPDTCIECDYDRDCTDPARPMCERAICVPTCANDAECPAIAPVCLGGNHCVECYDSIGLPCTDPAKPHCTWYLQCKGADEPYL